MKGLTGAEEVNYHLFSLDTAYNVIIIFRIEMKIWISNLLKLARQIIAFKCSFIDNTWFFAADQVLHKYNERKPFRNTPYPQSYMASFCSSQNIHQELSYRNISELSWE